ncbi:MAG: hypothetical protein QOD93_2446 [Acetobacteraceae bacterium]|jgi:hypothetical protein|nr:hypothetical protein [Acetobacteraceae bacterium]
MSVFGRRVSIGLAVSVAACATVAEPNADSGTRRGFNLKLSSSNETTRMGSGRNANRIPSVTGGVSARGDA